jgi:DNA mismatch repair protein MutL
VLFFTVPGRDVDVNVHPAKSEVRFRNESVIYSLVAEAVQAALSGSEDGSCEPPGEMARFRGTPPPQEPQHKFPGLQELRRETARDSSAPDYDDGRRDAGSFDVLPETARQPAPSPGPAAEEAALSIAPGRIFLGQLFSTYLLISDRERGLLIVDQHAAHERVLFHGFRQQGPGQTQLLAPPREIALHRSEKEALQKCADLLRRLGFAFDWDGGDTVSLRGVPSHLETSQGGEFLRDVLGERTDSMDGLWTVLACRKAVKAGEDLSRDEAAHLLEQWLQTPDRDYCPHGRPVAVRLQESDLERMFKRKR